MGIGGTTNGRRDSLDDVLFQMILKFDLNIILPAFLYNNYNNKKLNKIIERKNRAYSEGISQKVNL